MAGFFENSRDENGPTADVEGAGKEAADMGVRPARPSRVGRTVAGTMPAGFADSGGAAYVALFEGFVIAKGLADTRKSQALGRDFPVTFRPVCTERECAPLFSDECDADNLAEGWGFDIDAKRRALGKAGQIEGACRIVMDKRIGLLKVHSQGAVMIATNSHIPVDTQTVCSPCLACPMCGDAYVHPVGLECRSPGTANGQVTIDSRGVAIDPTVPPAGRGV